MGGDSFEGTEKLTDQQYKILVPQILQILQPLYIRAEPYIPLPEKEIHGDIDFLMILKPQVTLKSIVQALKIERFIINNNDTINSVYKNKQVDFCIKSNNRSFETAKFYKSYSGIGAHLGIFLNSKQIKLSDTGLYALAFKEHIKFQFLLTDSIEEILKFYGLSHERYFQGFATRKDLFQYLRDCCFMNQKTMIEHDCKNQSKLTKFFTQYLKSQTNIRQTSKIQLTNHLTQTLQYFKKQQQFNTEFANLLTSVTRKQELNKKFNAVHIIERFKVKPKQVNKLKQQFRSHFQNEQEYQKYIQNSKLEDILDMFEKVVKLCDKEDGGDKVGDDGGQQKWQLGVTKKERRANRRKEEKQQKQIKKQQHRDEVGISLQEKINEQTTIAKVEEK